jgi:hypothetical protein
MTERRIIPLQYDEPMKKGQARACPFSVFAAVSRAAVVSSPA